MDATVAMNQPTGPCFAPIVRRLGQHFSKSSPQFFADPLKAFRAVPVLVIKDRCCVSARFVKRYARTKIFVRSGDCTGNNITTADQHNGITQGNEGNGWAGMREHARINRLARELFPAFLFPLLRTKPFPAGSVLYRPPHRFFAQ